MRGTLLGETQPAAIYMPLAEPVEAVRVGRRLKAGAESESNPRLPCSAPNAGAPPILARLTRFGHRNGVSRVRETCRVGEIRDVASWWDPTTLATW